MCHELRTPFAGVMGCLNILHDAMEEMSSAEIKDMIKTSIETGNHMVQLLNDIVQSKDRKVHNVREKVVYAEFASGVVEGMRTMAANAQVAFDCRVSEMNGGNTGHLEMVLDRTKATQIVINSTSCVNRCCEVSVSLFVPSFTIVFPTLL